MLMHLWPVEEQRDEPDKPSVRAHCRLHHGRREERQAREAVRREDCAHEKRQCEQWRAEDPEHGEPSSRSDRRRRRVPTDGEEGSCRKASGGYTEAEGREHRPEATIGSEKEEC